MANIPFKYDLGSRVKDRVTELTGIVVGRYECLNGCLRYSVQPSVEKDKGHVMPDSWWVDEGQLAIVDAGLNEKPVAITRTGPPPTRIPAARSRC